MNEQPVEPQRTIDLVPAVKNPDTVDLTGAYQSAPPTEPSPTAVLTHLAVSTAVFDRVRPWPDAGVVVSIQTSSTPVLSA